MIEQAVSTLNRYFEDRIADCSRLEKELIADERRDEATFEKIRANVYDIFRTILSVAEKVGKGDPEAVRNFFVQKTEQIPSTWAASYEKAQQHNNAVGMQIEQIKLDTIDEIKKQFAKVWEEEK